MKNKNNGGFVFSTNPDFKIDEDANEQEETLVPAKQNLRISRSTKHRAGKEVTLVTGFVGSDDDLNDLGKMLKTKCGTGGSVKDREIIIQGDLRVKVQGILSALGYKVKVI